MKKLGVYLIISLGLILSSCASDKKDDPNSPSTDVRDKFIGYWNVNENSAIAGTNSHPVNIVKSTTNSTEIQLNNFSGLSVSARATINNNVITIPYQQLDSIGFTKGSGTLNSATSISMNYTTTISTNRDSCTAIYTKQ